MKVRDLASDPDLARKAIRAFPPLAEIIGPLPKQSRAVVRAPVVGEITCDFLDLGEERSRLLRLRVDAGLDDGTTTYEPDGVIHFLDDRTSLAFLRAGRDLHLVGCTMPTGDEAQFEEMELVADEIAMSIDGSIADISDATEEPPPPDPEPKPRPGPVAEESGRRRAAAAKRAVEDDIERHAESGRATCEPAASWLMTFAQFAQSSPVWVERRPQITYEAWAAPRGYPDGVSDAEGGRTGRRRESLMKLLREGQSIYGAAIRSGEIPSVEVREPIDVSTTVGMARARVLHKREIRRALDQGIAVPSGILAEYPDIGEDQMFPNRRGGCAEEGSRGDPGIEPPL